MPNIFGDITNYLDENGNPVSQAPIQIPDATQEAPQYIPAPGEQTYTPPDTKTQIENLLNPAEIKSLQDQSQKRDSVLWGLASLVPEIAPFARSRLESGAAERQAAQNAIANRLQLAEQLRLEESAREGRDIQKKQLQIQQEDAARKQVDWQSRQELVNDNIAKKYMIDSLTQFNPGLNTPENRKRLEMLSPRSVFQMADATLTRDEKQKTYQLAMNQINEQTKREREASAAQYELEKLKTQQGGSSDVDKKMAAEYSDLMSKGGFAQDEAGLQQAKEVLSTLKSGTVNASGKILGNLPKGVKDTLNAPGGALEDQARNVVLPMVKKLFPGATSNWEAETAINLVFNPRLSEAQNAAKMQEWVDKIDREIQNRKAAFKYFEQNNFSMKGYKGPEPSVKRFSSARDMREGEVGIVSIGGKDTVVKRVGDSVEVQEAQ